MAAAVADDGNVTMLVFAAVFDVDTAVAAELVAMNATDANDNDGKMVAADDDVDADDVAAGNPSYPGIAISQLSRI